MVTVIACDGSSRKKPNGEMRGPIGWAWARDDGHWQSNGWFEGTNQTAELNGLRAVLLFNPKGHIRVQADSQYVLNVATKWGKGWAKRNWVKADGKPVLNKPIIEQILYLLDARRDKIEFEWVKGHSKTNEHPLNTLADKYAGEASLRAKQANDMKTSLTDLYLDSKGRTFIEKEARMLHHIYSQTF